MAADLDKAVVITGASSDAGRARARESGARAEVPHHVSSAVSPATAESSAQRTGRGGRPGLG